MLAPSEQPFGVPAGDPVSRTVLQMRRDTATAFIGRESATRRKGATCRQIGQRGDHAFDLVQPRTAGSSRAPPPRGWESSRAALSCRGGRAIRTDAFALASSTFRAGVHHDHAVGILGDYAHVVGNQHDRSTEPRPATRASGREFAPGSSRPAQLSARRRSGAWDCTTPPSRSSPADACHRRAGADTRAPRRSASGICTRRSISTARSMASRRDSP